MNDLILRGPEPQYSRVQGGLGDFFFEKAEIFGDKTFQIDGNDGKIETFLTVRKRSIRVALYLKKIDIKPKDVVMVCCKNTSDNIIPVLAGLYLGAYVSSLDPKQGIPEFTHAINLVDPRVIFVEDTSLPTLEASLQSCGKSPKIVVIGKSDKYVQMSDLEFEQEDEKTFKPIKQKGSDICAILFSSGTTSAPKGVYISNNYVLNSCVGFLQHNHSQPGVFSHFSSLYWSSAWMYTAFCIIHGGSRVLLSSPDGKKFLQLVEKYKINYLFTSNTFTYEITGIPEEVIRDYDTSSLNCICIGGSRTDPNQILRLRKLLPHTRVVMGYGATEGGFVTCFDFSNKKAYEEKITSSGTVFPEIELKFVDLNTGEKLGPNKEGEIRIKSPNLMSGYHNVSVPDIFDEDGFYKLGDIGYYDEDNYIYVTDRLSDTFKYRTMQVSPTFIDHVLLTHPDVAEAVSFGVPHPIDRYHAAACVVLKKGKHVDVQELINFADNQLSEAYKLRAGIMIVESIPKTPTGKVQRRAIRDMFIKSNS